MATSMKKGQAAAVTVCAALSDRIFQLARTVAHFEQQGNSEAAARVREALDATYLLQEAAVNVQMAMQQFHV